MSTSKIAFITGANRGIGYSIARHLTASGISVIGTYHANAGEAKAAETTLSNENAKLRMLQLDIANHASFSDFAGQVKTLLASGFGQGELNYVVQNAGNIIHTRFDAATSEQLDNQYNIHFKGPYLLTVALLPLIRDGGRILNITSAATRFYLPDHGPYAAMKAATEVISLYMAKELGVRGITVNAVAPGQWHRTSAAVWFVTIPGSTRVSPRSRLWGASDNPTTSEPRSVPFCLTTCAG